MHTLIQLKRATSLFLIELGFVWLGLMPKAQAVSPPPDGGYPGGNTAEGQVALLSLTTGGFNTGLGYLALRSNMLGSFNTATGAGALLANTADNNTATGAGALLSNTMGSLNTANGAFALFSNTDGNDNTASGFEALFHNTTGVNNTATGDQALSNNTIGDENTANGVAALGFNTTGSNNTAIGGVALNSNTTGFGNTAVGWQALVTNSTGDRNTAVGYVALGFNGDGSNNTAVGQSALATATGNGNTAVGDSAAVGPSNTGNFNTAIGLEALFSISGGSGNTAIGDHAGFNQTSGSGNVYIGQGIQGVAGESDTCRIRSIFGQTAANGSAVFITSGNKLGTDTSSKRFKEAIKSMDRDSEALLALKPVTFRYKKEIDPDGKSQLGLVAEDVEKVNPDLVVRDKEGKPYSVRYDQVNAMLLNEFLKEHRKVEELESTVTKQQTTIAQQRQEFQATTVRQENEIRALTAGLNEQAAQNRKVSAQIELSKSCQVLVESR